MMDLNRATIMGNMTRDPELRYTPTNRQVISFTVATNRRWNNAEGERQEQAEFHDIVAWGKLAEICNQILYKGRKVYIEGRLQTRNWEGQDGVKRYKTEIIADNVIALGPAKTSVDTEESIAESKDTESQPKAGPPRAEKSKSAEKESKEEPKKDLPAGSPREAGKAGKEEEEEKEEEIDLDDIPF
jgi:single-strand DNA-binding protein